MNKDMFLDALRNTFKAAHVEDVDSIIEVYEEHFTIGYEKGLSDTDIIKSLGTPEEIYTSYVDEGVITDVSTDLKEGKRINMTALYERLDDYKAKILPQLPGVARSATRTLLLLGSVLSYIAGVLIFVITPAIVYLLGLSWQPFENITALPALSLVTLIALIGTGLFSGLTCVFIGSELKNVRNRFFN